MERDSFVFYRSFYEAIVELPREIQGEVLTAVIEYGLYGETTESLKPIAKAMMALIKPQLDANNKRFENGCKGGAPLGNTNAKKQPKTTEEQPKNNQKQPNVNVNDNVNDIKETISKEIVKKSATNVATLAERKQSFALSLEPYLAKYSRDMLNDFYSYWTEENQSRTKMRFELEKTWGLGNRLATWAKRENNFKTSNNGNKNYHEIDANEINAIVEAGFSLAANN